MSQCMRASKDGQITNKEKSSLARLGTKLQISPADEQKYLNAAKNSVYQDQLSETLSDGVISDDEAETLRELRKTLGLSAMDRSEFDYELRMMLGPASMERSEFDPSKRHPRKTKQRPQQRCRGYRPQNLTLLRCDGPLLGTMPWKKRMSLLFPYILLSMFPLTFIGLIVYAGITFRFVFPLLTVLTVSSVYLVLATRCKSCRANWAVGSTGVSETRMGWISAEKWDQHVCNYCRNQTWRKYRPELAIILRSGCVIATGYVWVGLGLGKVESILYLVRRFKDRCKSCKANWAVYPTGVTERIQSTSFFSSGGSKSEYKCEFCGNQTWRVVQSVSDGYDSGGGCA